ncbi:MAG TPA: hypothetical protein VGI71_24000 [Scandinavium sp.]|jgi:hypothetical protein
MPEKAVHVVKGHLGTNITSNKRVPVAIQIDDMSVVIGEATVTRGEFTAHIKGEFAEILAGKFKGPFKITMDNSGST